VSGKKTLIVVEPDNRLLSRATKNLPRVTAISAKSLNVVDVMAHEFVLASKDAVATLEKTFGVNKKA
jgi:ribosomal protein L4